MKITPALSAIALLACAAPLAPASAAPEHAVVPANPETEAMAAKFFGLLKSGGGAPALAYIATLSPLYASKIGELQVMTTQIDGAIKVYGPPVTWERVSGDTLGTSARMDTYLVQHGNNVTRWRLYFARTPKGWNISSFNFDDQIPNWF